MEARIVNEILGKNEHLLKRHLVLSKTVLEKLSQNGLLTEVIRKKILVSYSLTFKIQLRQLIPYSIRTMHINVTVYQSSRNTFTNS